MNQPCNLVVCTDLSQPSLLAISRALSLTELFQGRCSVVHVLPKHWLSDLQRVLGISDDLLQRNAIERQSQSLNEQVSRLWQKRPLDVHTRLRIGEPADQIAAQVQEDQADLVIMGSHGKGHVGHLLMGSTALAVLHQSACPVLVVRTPQQLPYRKVLLAIDLTPASLHLVKAAQAFANDANFVLVHVLQTAFDEMSELGLLASADQARCQEAVVVDTYARLGMLALRCGLTPGRFQIEIIPGGSAQALVEHAHKHSVDLIVTAKHGAHNMRDRLLGSFTQTILTQSICDVLVVPPPLPAKAADSNDNSPTSR